MTASPILLATVGTSMLGNLKTLKAEDQPELLRAFVARDWQALGRALADLPGNLPVCGAEVNSVASMIEHGYAARDCGIFFFHSDTDDGRNLAGALTECFRRRGHAPVEAVQVPDLQDSDPRRFRTHGLRNLARLLCKTIRERSAQACAINATGGYKAQIAIAVLLGQAIGVPVYYKHERFSEIIAFPPMPVALDFNVWMKSSGVLNVLAKLSEPVPVSEFEDEWDEKFESLVERVPIDGQEYVELAATGQIFHETFRERFRSHRDQLLPPHAAASQKKKPQLEKAGWPGEHPEVERFMQAVTDEVPQVIQCRTHYYNPDLRRPTRFRMSSRGIECLFSQGNYAVKFIVETTATTEGQKEAMVASLNEWLEERG